MKEITQKIYQLMVENEIPKSQILTTLENVYDDLVNNLWETTTVGSELFYSLKDIVWYNLEHLPSNGEPNGISDLRFLGTKFPHFIYACNSGDIIELKDVPNFLSELDTIYRQWNKNWAFVGLYTKSQNGWKGGENPTKVIIHGYKENPSSYGYNQYYNVLNSSGDKFKKFDIETALCCVDGEIGEYANAKLLQNLIVTLINCCKNAIKNQRDIKIVFG